MSSEWIWYAARAGGIVAYLLMTASVLVGIAHASRRVRAMPRFAVEEIHRFLGTLSAVFIAIHVGGILLDPHEGEVQVLEVLAGFREEHGEVVRDVHGPSERLPVDERVRGREAEGRGVRDALRGAHHQVAARLQGAGDAAVHVVACSVVEVDDDVAAEHEVPAGLVAHPQEVVDAEGDVTAEVRGGLPAAVRLAEEARLDLRRHVPHVRVGEPAALRARHDPLVDVRADDLERAAELGADAGERYFQDLTNLANKGWYVDLPDGGERIVQNAQMDGSYLVTASMIPSGNSCADASGSGYINAITPFPDMPAGGRSYFDLDGVGGTDDAGTDGKPTGSIKTNGIPTLPLLLPNLLVVLVLAAIKAVQTFDEVFVLTGGGPGSATTFVVQFIYQTGFQEQVRLYGLAAAGSLLLAVALIALTLLQLKISRAEEAGERAR